MPRGVINVKFEGVIDNSTNPLVSTSAPANAAFFARTVHIKKGPVIPPSVPYEPYVAPTVYHKGQNALKGSFKLDHIPSNLRLLRDAAEGREPQESQVTARRIDDGRGAPADGGGHRPVRMARPAISRRYQAPWNLIARTAS